MNEDYKIISFNPNGIEAILKKDGEILKIGNKVFNRKTKQIGIIDQFKVIFGNIYIYIKGIEPSWNINDTKLDKEVEIKEKQPLPLVIETYTINDIEIVLSKALDKPEVDTIICDFIKYKKIIENVIIIDPLLELAKPIEFPHSFHVIITKENRELVKQWQPGCFKYNIGAYYGQIGNKQWRKSNSQSIDNNSIEITDNQLYEIVKRKEFEYTKYPSSYK